MRKRSIIDASRGEEWIEKLADSPRSLDGGGYDRPHPFDVIRIWAGFVLAKNRGSAVTRA